MKQDIKLNYNVDVDVTSPLMTWIVKHASWLHNRYQLHSDGKTSYERRWGNNYVKPTCEFAETIRFKYSAGANTKAAIDWDHGIWQGRCTQSDEHYVATKNNVYRTRSVKRLNAPEI